MKSTIFLPNTKFLARIKSCERAGLDSKLTVLGDLHGFYNWQLSGRFILLDGPPYANGEAHVGHAINKILKDFIVKSQVMNGNRVKYRPGWDCHGLPIELKIEKSAQTQNPLEIRKMAGELALTSIHGQMNSFKKWGVSADWDNYYCTMKPDYIAKQLRIFANLYEKGYVYRDFKPVYWSPSSKTALAESELEYNASHKSLAVYFKFHIINFDLSKTGLSLVSTAKIPLHFFALVWTTTPWTLPLNNAIAYSPTLKYVLIEFNEKRRKAIREVFIVAESLLDKLKQELQRDFVVHGSVLGNVLGDLFYRSVIFPELALPFVSADFVSTMGTGLVHSSYAHGFDDHKIALLRNDKVECFVDEEGRYSRQMGYDLEGKEVLGDGTDAVLKKLKKDIVHSADYIHSYPYDWRTKKPIIIRCSKQWFIDIANVGPQSAAILSTQNIKVGGGEHDQSTALNTEFINRPFWCISRQRVWGVPIPCLINKATGKAKTSGDFIRFVAELIAQNPVHGADIWWRNSVKELFKNNAFPKSFLSVDASVAEARYEKSTDVMDVWLDSGVAWHTLDESKIDDINKNLTVTQADVVLEGVDQIRGWFQSLFLTSVAVNTKAPCKRVLVHGFAVDDNGHKMSKSVGNIVSPDAVTDGTIKTDAIGVDGLRLWVALNGAECVNDVRIGALSGWKKFAPIDNLANKEKIRLTTLDNYILLRTRELIIKTEKQYNEYCFRSIANTFIQFLQNPISSLYINCVRDRLYCASVGSPEHNGARYTIDCVGRALSAIIAPILPHLAVEFYSHHPLLHKDCQLSVRQSFADVRQMLLANTSIPTSASDSNDLTKADQKLHNIMGCVQNIRAQLYQAIVTEMAQFPSKNKIKSMNLQKRGAIITALPPAFELLNEIYKQDDHTCDLNELLGLSRIELLPWLTDDNYTGPTGANASNNQNIYQVKATIFNLPTTMYSTCQRCRKNVCVKATNNCRNVNICIRCNKAINRIEK